MKKSKKRQQARIEACSEKIREFFHSKVIPSENQQHIADFNSEWISLSKLFSNKMVSLKDYEKRVLSLCSKWEKSL
jgi:hypothetical protein